MTKDECKLELILLGATVSVLVDYSFHLPNYDVGIFLFGSPIDKKVCEVKDGNTRHTYAKYEYMMQWLYRRLKHE